MGSLVAVILLQFGLRTLGAYLQNAFAISQLYGSLGLIPLFMFWVYLMWLAVLFGLEVSATLQMLHGRRLEEMERKRELTGLVDPTSIVWVMEIIAARFHQGRSTTGQLVSDETQIPRPTVARMLERLVDAQLLNRVEHSDDAVCLARPPEQIAAQQLVEIGYSLVDVGETRGKSHLFERLRQAQQALAHEMTLASLVPAPRSA
jgi:membrane protein